MPLAWRAGLQALLRQQRSLGTLHAVQTLSNGLMQAESASESSHACGSAAPGPVHSGHSQHQEGILPPGWRAFSSGSDDSQEPAGAGGGPQGTAAAQVPLERNDPADRETVAVVGSLQLDKRSKELSAEHIGQYYRFTSALVPEAFQPFHQTFYAPRPGHLQRKGGCRALQAELKASGSTHLMYRRCMHELRMALEARGGAHILLEGPAGAGKSMSLVALVEWARSQGWLALYVPSAAALVSGGFFYRRSDGSGLYDTRISAQHILKSVHDAHRQQLADMPSRLARTALPSAANAWAGSNDAATTGAAAPAPAGGLPPPSASSSLLDLVLEGLGTDTDGHLAVESALALVRELVAAADSGTTRVLLALDDYNCLYWRTGYGANVRVGYEEDAKRGRHRRYEYRRELAVEELALASGLRLLAPGMAEGMGGAAVVAATSASRGVSSRVRVPLASGVEVYHVPRLSEVETAHVMHYYAERGLLGEVPSEQQVARLRAVTNGNAAELREVVLQASVYDMMAHA